MAKFLIALIVAIAFVASVVANDNHRFCHKSRGEVLQGPGLACELVCSPKPGTKPTKHCWRLPTARCLCCAESRFCRNIRTGHCEKIHHG